MSAMTLTEKILARHADRPTVAPGENVWVKVDILMTHDVCGPGTIGVFHEQFGRNARVWDASRVVIIPDHYIFTADDKCHRNVQILRDFVKEQGIRYFYDAEFVKNQPGMPSPYKDPTKTSYKGVCHKALPEEGHVRPGEILFGTDSHTCTAGAFGQFATGIGNTEGGFVLGTGKLWLKVPPTMKFTFHGQIPPYLTAKDLILAVIGRIGVDGATYRSMYFAGEGISSLTLEDRMTLTNMAIEAGGKNGVCDVDEKTLQYVRKRSNLPNWEVVRDDPGAQYIEQYEWDLAKMEPMVAKPHSPDNKDTARNCQSVKIDRAYLGSCTGGKITDMIFAANVVNGQKVKVPTFVVPGSTEVHSDMKKLNLRGMPKQTGERSIEETLLDAGCMVGPSGCAACLGGPADTFGRLQTTEVCVSTTNRNFPGRMGSKNAAVYLASPLTVAASAITGHITDPRQFVSKRIETGTAGVVESAHRFDTLVSMAQPTIIMAADYADTLLTFRRAKNWLVLLLLIALLIQLAIFFTARYSSVLPAANPQATTEPALTAATLAPTPGRQMMQYLTSLTAYAGIVLSIVLALVLLATLNLMLIARLVGLSKLASAFVWCLILMGLLFPWQAFLNQTAATAGDLRIPGVLFTWSELIVWGKFGVDDVPNAILKWSRFVVFPIIAIGLVLFIQLRSRHGIRLALGEQAPPGVMEVKT